MTITPLRRGIGRVEIIAIVLAVLFILGLAIPAFQRSRCGAVGLRDKTHVRQLHRAMVLFAIDNQSIYPTPGRIRPIKTIDASGASSTQPDYALNHSAPMYSALVAQRYIDPEILVSPSSSGPMRCFEECSYISAKTDYNYDAYNPAANSYWDSTFVMRLDDPKIGANSSYAHMAICGDRRDNLWRDTQNPNVVVLGTRGTRNGATSGPEYDRSPTLKLHGPKQQWDGHVAFADNHTDTLQNFFPNTAAFADATGKLQRDNIFAAEFPHPHGNQAAADSFLGVFIGSSEFTVDPVYDPLE
jgi:hypothetical protein